jgi:tetratricopeptide (TPR) repeat protein
VAAEGYYRRAVQTPTDPFYRLYAYRTFAWFLFNQSRFDEARELYEKAFAQFTLTDNVGLYQRDLTYQFWGINELNLANSPRQAVTAFERAASEFNRIGIESLRQSALKNLADAKVPTPAQAVPIPPNAEVAAEGTKVLPELWR